MVTFCISEDLLTLNIGKPTTCLELTLYLILNTAFKGNDVLLLCFNRKSFSGRHQATVNGIDATIYKAGLIPSKKYDNLGYYLAVTSCSISATHSLRARPKIRVNLHYIAAFYFGFLLNILQYEVL